MMPSKDVNFVGYTYKNVEIVKESLDPVGKICTFCQFEDLG